MTPSNSEEQIRSHDLESLFLGDLIPCQVIAESTWWIIKSQRRPRCQ